MAKLHQIVKNAYISLLELVIVQMTLNNVCGILPLFLLSSQLVLVDLGRYGILTASRALETEAFSQTVHVSVDHFVSCEVPRILPVGVCAICGRLTNHCALFQRVWHREAGSESELLVSHSENFICDH